MAPQGTNIVKSTKRKRRTRPKNVVQFVSAVTTGSRCQSLELDPETGKYEWVEKPPPSWMVDTPNSPALLDEKVLFKK